MKLTEEQFSPAEFSSLSVDFVTDFCTLMADATSVADAKRVGSREG